MTWRFIGSRDPTIMYYVLPTSDQKFRTKISFTRRSIQRLLGNLATGPESGQAALIDRRHKSSVWIAYYSRAACPTRERHARPDTEARICAITQQQEAKQKKKERKEKARGSFPTKLNETARLTWRLKRGSSVLFNLGDPDRAAWAGSSVPLWHKTAEIVRRTK